MCRLTFLISTAKKKERKPWSNPRGVRHSGYGVAALPFWCP